MQDQRINAPLKSLEGVLDITVLLQMIFSLELRVYLRRLDKMLEFQPKYIQNQEI